MINEDLLPTLATLDRQRQAYIEYATMSASVERLKRFVIAFDYTRCAQAREDGEKEVAELQAGIAAAEAQRKELEAEVSDVLPDVTCCNELKERNAWWCVSPQRVSCAMSGCSRLLDNCSTALVCRQLFRNCLQTRPRVNPACR